MSILGSNGKNATPGLPCLYHLMSGLIFYSETAKEDHDSYVFDGDKTCLCNLTQGQKGSININLVKLSDTGFKAKKTRVFKTNIALISDTSQEEMIRKAHEAMSGIVIAGPGAN